MPTPRTRLGDWGEQVAQRFLADKGYRILGTKYRCAHGEIDIIARDGDELVFVEVRTRRQSGYGQPEESITAAKAQRLMKTGYDYLQAQELESASWRIDLVGVNVTQRRKLDRIYHILYAVET
jgi:putative endonuclease